VARQTEEDVLRRLELERSAGRPDVLVVVLLSGREVLAEAGVAEPCAGDTDPKGAGEGGGSAGYRIDLPMGAEIGPRAEVRPIGRDCRRYIFDGAADGVAAVKRALR